jgi:hypothetical protein
MQAGAALATTRVALERQEVAAEAEAALLMATITVRVANGMADTENILCV